MIFRDPLFTEQRDRVLELCDEIQRRGLTLTFEAETRLDRLDIELLDKLYARRLSRHELRRRIARPGDAEEIGPPADSAGAPARDHGALPRARHRHRRVLRARVPAGRLELDRGDDRLRDRPGVDLRAVQDADAVSGHADVQADPAAAHRDATGRNSTATRRPSAIRTSPTASCASCSAPPTSGSTCGRRTSPTS